jgi:hypothetical protein
MRLWGLRLKTSLTNWLNHVSMTGVGVELHPDRQKRKTKVTMVMNLQTLLRSIERRDVDHLRKLMLISGRVGSD